MSKIEWPTVEKVTAKLEQVKSDVPEKTPEDDETPSIEVRLQVLEDGQWNIHTGDVQYISDHNGFWGCSYVEADSDCAEIAAELIEEAQDHAYIHGEDNG